MSKKRGSSSQNAGFLTTVEDEYRWKGLDSSQQSAVSHNCGDKFFLLSLFNTVWRTLSL